MGMPAALERRWTAAEVRALPEEPGKHYEVIDGKLFVSPGPSWRHQRVVGALLVLLRAYTHEQRAGDVLTGPGEIEADEFTLLQPDVFVVPLSDGRPAESWDDVRRLLLAIEVLSPSSRRKDRVVKRHKYLEMGAEYWIVDPDAQLIERWAPGDDRAEIVSGAITWRADGAADPITIDLRSIFSESRNA
jgi:Uma2 family endonuclease